METYAAKIDTNGDVEQVIVIPPGTADAAAFCASLGLSGTWADCPKLPGKGWRRHEGDYYPHWQQIEAADTGPEGAESGYLTGTELWHDGAVWVSRTDFNVGEPLSDGETTWSRKDGTYVTPAGWEYQPGEEVTEDGERWFRVEQATSFAPSASPSQYVELDGPGGEPVAPAAGEWQAGTAYAVGDEVTYQGATYRCITGHTSQTGWEPPNVTALWEVV